MVYINNDLRERTKNIFAFSLIVENAVFCELGWKLCKNMCFVVWKSIPVVIKNSPLQFDIFVHNEIKFPLLFSDMNDNYL